VNNFKYHTWWHLALYYLEREDFPKVLELYDTEFRKELTDDHIDIANATSMLLRLEMRDVDIGNRWDELGEVCAKHLNDHLFAFHDAHYMMAIAGAGRANDVDSMLRTMTEAAARDDTTEAAVYRDVGLPLSKAIVASRNKEYGKVVDLLAPVRYQVYQIGGSHAQRDVFGQLLVHAAIADGRYALARALLGERVERRPGSSLNWRWLGETLEGLGETNGAAEARGKAENLIVA
jgi:tetratricopeptide (TPR) repeat protein